ncbi:MAG: hypothetical protein Q8O95_05775 [bacterium]|nr:hypothetical protein [bacterium]
MNIVRNLFLSLFVFAFSVSLCSQASAFSMTISPARQTFELERGESREYVISFTNGSETGDFSVNVHDFVYTPTGSTQPINPDQLADPSQSLDQWIQVKDRFTAVQGESSKVAVRINVPENAQYGSHFGMVTFAPVEAEMSAMVGVSGAINSVVFIKVLGGEEIRSGDLEEFRSESQERARNTVNFFTKYNNTGNTFFDVLAEISIFDINDPSSPIKLLRDTFVSFPNVVSNVQIPLGDLGDNYGEKEYRAILKLYDSPKTGEKGEQLVSEIIDFQYYLPYTGDEPGAIEKIIEKEIVVTPPIIAIVKELAPYIGGFLVLMIVLVWVLARKGKKKRK